jgi:hypothetical protein
LGFRRWIQTTPDMTPYPGYIMGLSHRRYRSAHDALCQYRVSVKTVRCC